MDENLRCQAIHPTGALTTAGKVEQPTGRDNEQAPRLDCVLFGWDLNGAVRENTFSTSFANGGGIFLLEGLLLRNVL